MNDTCASLTKGRVYRSESEGKAAQPGAEEKRAERKEKRGFSQSSVFFSPKPHR
jgi:hypothetical protein